MKEIKEDNQKNIIVRNKAGFTRRARKSELKWFADRGFAEVSAQASRGFVPKGQQPIVKSQQPDARWGEASEILNIL